MRNGRNSGYGGSIDVDSSSYTRSSTGDGAEEASDSGSTDYSWEQTGDPHSGTFDLSKTGTSRYELLEDFFDISNTGGGQTPGHMNVYPFGQTFVDPNDDVLAQGGQPGRREDPGLRLQLIRLEGRLEVLQADLARAIRERNSVAPVTAIVIGSVAVRAGGMMGPLSAPGLPTLGLLDGFLRKANNVIDPIIRQIRILERQILELEELLGRTRPIL